MKLPHFTIMSHTMGRRRNFDRSGPIHLTSIGRITLYVCDGWLVKLIYSDPKKGNEEYYLNMHNIQKLFPNCTIKNKCTMDEIKVHLLRMMGEEVERLLVPALLSTMLGDKSNA